jgi:hypothetical protein
MQAICVVFKAAVTGPASAAMQALAACRRHTSRAASVVEPLLWYGSAGLWPAQGPSLPWGIATAAAPAPALAAVLRLLLLLLRSAEDSEGGGCGMGRDADEAEGSHSYRREVLCYRSQIKLQPGGSQVFSVSRALRRGGVALQAVNSAVARIWHKSLLPAGCRSCCCRSCWCRPVGGWRQILAGAAPPSPPGAHHNPKA